MSANSPHRSGDFPPTRHSVIARAGDDDAAARQLAVGVLVEAYWKPVYKYVRLRWNAQAEDAEDLTQGFFAGALESSFFRRYDASRARFRTYLRTCVDGFVANARAATSRHKRGGGAVHVPLDFAGAEDELRGAEPTAADDPESLFRDEWVRRMFELALEDLRAHCRETGKDAHFAIFERYDLEPPESHGRRVTYDELAREFALPVTQVTNFLADARRRFRAALLERVRETTATEEEFRAEVRDLLGADPR